MVVTWFEGVFRHMPGKKENCEWLRSLYVVSDLRFVSGIYQIKTAKHTSAKFANYCYYYYYHYYLFLELSPW
jgi:hypothetical protein